MASASDVLTISRRSWRWLLPATAGAACVVVGGVLLASGPGPADVGVAPPVVAAAPVDPAPVDSAPVDPAPIVAGTVPVQVALPARGVTAPVVPVGTAPGGAMVIPEPPSTVGWWAPGPLAGGSAGRAVLAGHVDTAADGIGALAVLREAVVGEPVEVSGADGRLLRYEIVARREYRKADLPVAELFTAGGPPGLVLITCGGDFDPATGHYEDNVVVHAVPA